MEVSTFELLVKRIAPRMALPPAERPVARRVVQGYFLTLSNLEAIDLRYRLEFRISLPDNPSQADAVTRVLEGNTFLIYDIAGANTILTLTRVGTTGRYISQEFVIPAQKTASIELLPDVRFAAEDDPTLEIRGFASLLLPRVFTGTTAIERLIGRPQSPRPVKVLLNAEVRGTFLPNDFPANSASTDFDQINYSLALASGKALNEIVSEPPRVLVPGSPIGLELAPGAVRMTSTTPDSTAVDLGAMIAGLLTASNGNGTSLESLNGSLAELSLPLTVTGT
ncbi:MAG: hypothetical protein KME10_01325 [Plectolyngbya sp. WJT66-NPBG17]|jgi:hypothetical protein|nr:hypothetical protein [Plectolyngbya sp. WJT66-NPBG17]MBW4523819.1 hypothetical protein [Phormidium tanganyikae FI6-MK23]